MAAYRRPASAATTTRLWEERFGRAGEAIGRTLQLDSRLYTIVGVVPARFRGRTDQAVVWTPVRATLPPNALTQRGNRGSRRSGGFGLV